MTVVRVTLRTPRGELAHWSYLIGLSAALHVAAGVALIFLPMVLRPKLKFPEVYTVDLMSLPAGAPGPKAAGPETPQTASPSPPAPKPAPPVAKPAPKPTVKAPAPPPPKPKAAIKIPEKPTDKATKPKPAEKAKEPPAKEPEKTSNASTEESTGEEAGGSNGSEAKPSAKGSDTSTSTGSSPGGGGPGGGGGGGAGGMVDDPTFQYGWYIANVQGIISRNWSRPIKPDMTRSLVALVRFRIMKDGSLSDIVLAQSSGDAALDRSSMRAVQDSNPLPPLPYQFGKDSVGFTLEFELNPD